MSLDSYIYKQTYFDNPHNSNIRLIKEEKVLEINSCWALHYFICQHEEIYSDTAKNVDITYSLAILRDVITELHDTHDPDIAADEFPVYDGEYDDLYWECVEQIYKALINIFTNDPELNSVYYYYGWY